MQIVHVGMGQTWGTKEATKTGRDPSPSTKSSYGGAEIWLIPRMYCQLRFLPSPKMALWYLTGKPRVWGQKTLFPVIVPPIHWLWLTSTCNTWQTGTGILRSIGLSRLIRGKLGCKLKIPNSSARNDIQDVRTVIIVVCNNMYLSHGKLMQHWKSQIWIQYISYMDPSAGLFIAMPDHGVSFVWHIKIWMPAAIPRAEQTLVPSTHIPWIEEIGLDSWTFKMVKCWGFQTSTIFLELDG